METPKGAADRVSLRRFALGIRFQNQFGLEDNLGAVIDDVLSSDRFSRERFENTTFTGDTRQIFTADGDETLTFTRSDAILDMRPKGVAIEDIGPVAQDFVDIVWDAVCRRAPRPPDILRYGCLVAFPLPEGWNPMQAILGTEPTDNAEFDLRYTRRLISEEALAMRDISDFRTVIYMIQTRKGKTTGVIDYQHNFLPALGSNTARKENPFTRFVEKAVAFQRGQGWDFLKTRMERLPQAA